VEHVWCTIGGLEGGGWKAKAVFSGDYQGRVLISSSVVIHHRLSMTERNGYFLPAKTR